MGETDVVESTLDEWQQEVARDRVRQHFKAAIDFFDEVLAPGKVLECPQLLAAFVQAVAMESLTLALKQRSDSAMLTDHAAMN